MTCAVEVARCELAQEADFAIASLSEDLARLKDVRASSRFAIYH